ncbi:MBL fold metallo-hydrolase [Bradyrhizobium sp. Arg237L]|uniref:MBL fold metallo-hydrolase n=1 Tax=Bradyrhizobium sp. Arg237L TaxID=3003352 RepID=UPI00249D9F95|nr:MBL fold metallo-hydrolase [Bradyrhizobium sp. Arg237L]MDI4232501.1 MBL fold metallo-hydrolase [Bradyrhizobium sp. Arg237L]
MSTQLPDPIIIPSKAGDALIHTFVAGFTGDNIANATHIIESKNILVLVDGQFLAPYATQFRAYADSLRKPIERLYLSHRHPDHWFGLGTAFGDVEIYALQETIDFIKQHGEESRQDHLEKMGGLAPKNIVVPQNVVKRGTETVDGITYVFDKVIDTEIDFLLTMRLPELQVCIPQDLIYSGTHLYLTKDFGNWIKVLQKMLASDDKLFLAGHGFPANRTEVAKNIEYLSAASQAMARGLNKDDFKEHLLRRYPGRLCPGIFDIYLPRLFDAASQF